MERYRLTQIFLFMTIFIFLLCFVCFASVEAIQKAFLEENFVEVIKKCSQIIENNPRISLAQEAYLYRGLSNLKLSNFPDARGDFQFIIDKSPDAEFVDRAYLGWGDSYYLEENFNEALKQYQNITKRTSSDYLSVAYFKLAKANLKLGNWQLAKELADKIRREFPRSFEARLVDKLSLQDEYFTVQVGSFVDEQRAKGLCEELKSKGKDAFITNIDSDGKQFFRVRVGKFSTRLEAEELQSNLINEGYPTKIFP